MTTFRKLPFTQKRTLLDAVMRTPAWSELLDFERAFLAARYGLPISGRGPLSVRVCAPMFGVSRADFKKVLRKATKRLGVAR